MREGTYMLTLLPYFFLLPMKACMHARILTIFKKIHFYTQYLCTKLPYLKDTIFWNDILNIFVWLVYMYNHSCPCCYAFLPNTFSSYVI